MCSRAASGGGGERPAAGEDVGRDCGVDPRPRGDSRELFDISADSKLTAVAFAAGAPAAPRALFPVRLAPPESDGEAREWVN